MDTPFFRHQFLAICTLFAHEIDMIWLEISGNPQSSPEVEGVNSVQRVVCGGCLDFKARASVFALDIRSLSTFLADHR